RLQIKDNGIGFDAGYKDQVFELFKRLHPESGRGIGLALCKKIIENHNGDITIDSQEGEGTTVTILLPVQKNYCV
ncbi:MAG: histidine kinase, partial [Flavisolibacter sp.]|nr:histidine kinase [Flavisolibacter sp.]